MVFDLARGVAGRLDYTDKVAISFSMTAFMCRYLQPVITPP